jgi:hypothetical protein
VTFSSSRVPEGHLIRSGDAAELLFFPL